MSYGSYKSSGSISESMGSFTGSSGGSGGSGGFGYESSASSEICDCSEYLNGSLAYAIGRTWRKEATYTGEGGLSVGELIGTFPNRVPETPAGPTADENDDSWDLVPYVSGYANVVGAVILDVCGVTTIKFKVTTDRDDGSATVTFKVNGITKSGTLVLVIGPDPQDTGGVINITAAGGGAEWTYELDLSSAEACYNTISVEADFSQRTTDTPYCRVVVEQVT